jgi:DNA-binding XRE family transcriptional regulator
MVQQMGDSNGLYKELGRKIRATRERVHPKLSQDKLAKRLGISRASVVNIEAGRQHAPLQLLWRIAENLETELALLIPKRAELLVSVASVELDAKTIEQIKHVAEGNKETQKALTGIVSKLRTTLETTAQTKRKGTP